MRGEFIGVWSETWREIGSPKRCRVSTARLTATSPTIDLRWQLYLKLRRVLL